MTKRYGTPRWMRRLASKHDQPYLALAVLDLVRPEKKDAERLLSEINLEIAEIRARACTWQQRLETKGK